MNYHELPCFVRDAISATDQPSARLQTVGAAALRDAELISILVEDEAQGRAILAQHPTPQLLSMNVEALHTAGIDPMTANKTVAAFELARRGLGQGLGVLPMINCPSDAVPLLTEIRGQRKEYFLCLYLNARNQMIHKEVVSIGSLSASIVHPREVFSLAVEHSAASILMAHNHPSGDTTPSRDDIELTRRMRSAGQIMGIEVLDHLVLTAQDFLSLKEQGLV